MHACLLALLPACLPACLATCMHACVLACMLACDLACLLACPLVYFCLDPRSAGTSPLMAGRDSATGCANPFHSASFFFPYCLLHNGHLHLAPPRTVSPSVPGPPASYDHHVSPQVGWLPPLGRRALATLKDSHGGRWFTSALCLELSIRLISLPFKTKTPMNKNTLSNTYSRRQRGTGKRLRPP